MKSGLGKVFSFNFRERTASSKYRMVTVVIALILLLGIFFLDTTLTKKIVENDATAYEVDEVLVLDEIGVGVADYAAMAEYFGYSEAAGTKFTKVEGTAEEILADQAVNGYLFVQKKVEDGFLVEIITGKDVDTSSAVVKKNVSVLHDIAEAGLKSQILEKSDLTQGQLIQALFPVSIEVVTLGESEANDMMQTVRNITTTIIVILIYFMVLIYGSSICADVPTEKTSKLVEQVLMSISARTLVAGKILAGIASCLLQMLIWIASLFGGVLLGEMQVVSKFGLEEGYVTGFLKSASTLFGMDGFSPLRVALCIFAFLLGMAFYLSLAGLAGATLTRPENAGNVTAIFVFPLLIAYVIMLTVSPISKYTGAFVAMPLWYHFIPFTAAMSLPASTLVGELSIPIALLAVVVNIVWFAIAFWAAGKIYKGLLFFNGAKVAPKDVIAALKQK